MTIRQIYYTLCTICIFACDRPQKSQDSNQLVSDDLTAVEKVKLKGEIVENQTFNVEWEELGSVRFVPTRDKMKLFFYLMKDDEVIYEFPAFEGNTWNLDELIAIGFSDVNKDNRKDVIILTSCITGVGSQGMVPFPVNAIYLNGGAKFDYPSELNSKLNSYSQENLASMNTIQSIRDYLKVYYSSE